MVYAVTTSSVSGLFKVWIEAAVNYQWSHKTTLSLLHLILLWLVLPLALMLLCHKLLSYLLFQLVKELHMKNISLALLSKDLEKCNIKKRAQSKISNIIEPRPFVNARSSPIYVKHYIKILIFTFSLQNPLSV